MHGEEMNKVLKALTKAEFSKLYMGTFPKPRWPHHVFAIAGEYRIAKSWAIENEVPRELFHYVGDLEHVRGASGQVVYLWNWWELRDIDGIIECVKYLTRNKQLEVIDGGEKWGASPPL